MNHISIKDIIYSKSPGFLSKYPSFISDLFFSLLNRLLFVPRINRFISEHGDKTGIEFIDELFDQLDISYRISSKDREKIPSEGKLIIVANHPLLNVGASTFGYTGKSLRVNIIKVEPDKTHCELHKLNESSEVKIEDLFRKEYQTILRLSPI